MIYENRRQKPISRRDFTWRLLRHGGYAAVLVVVSAVIGTAGYHWFGGLAWVDAFLNACMLLGGMGPIGELATNAGKIFAAFFALYSGLVFLAATVILLTPVLHRTFHKFHWDADQERTKAS